MADSSAKERKLAKARRHGRMAAALMRLLGITLRVKLHDHCGFLSTRPDHPLIHAFWHNGIFTIPMVYRANWPDRSGAVLTSASRDGELVASVMKEFGISSVRGSSSRRGVAAIIELKKWIENGYDIAITPDGPRGPKYRLQPGLVLLAQKTQVPILPCRMSYGRAWELKTWDGFRIPLPFSRVDVHLGPYLEVPDQLTEEAFEQERLRIESVLTSEPT
ncbi:MAG: lysophospholipid acyltransferase family protein [Verrucomicrobiota bacterium]